MLINVQKTYGNVQKCLKTHKILEKWKRDTNIYENVQTNQNDIKDTGNVKKYAEQVKFKNILKNA